MSQAAIAGRMGLVQSEVSRLETTVGPGTRFGRLCKYLDACGARITLTVRTARGRELAWSPAPDQASSTAGQPTVSAAVPGPAIGWAPARLTQMLDDILALEECLQQVGVEPGEASRIRHAFLTRLQARQQPASPAAACRGSARPIGAGRSLAPEGWAWPAIDPTLGDCLYPLPDFYQQAFGTAGPMTTSSPSEPPADLGGGPAAVGKSGG